VQPSVVGQQTKRLPRGNVACTVRRARRWTVKFRNVPDPVLYAGLGVARPPLEPPIGSASSLGIRLACRIDRAVAREAPDGLDRTVHGARCRARGAEVFTPRLSVGDDRPRPRGAAS
jgi:hypothetical protein